MLRSFCKRAAVVAPLFALFVAPALAADEPKPVIASETKAIEASVVIDPALKAWPALYEKLLASGKREYDKARKDAADEFKSDPETFSDGRKFYYKRTDTMRSNAGGYVSVVRSNDTYTGGAHPNHDVDTLLWDTAANRFVNIKPFFTEMTDDGPTLQLLAREIRAALLTEKKARGIEVANPAKDEWLSNVKPKITDIGGIALAPSTDKNKSAGFIAYFSPYAVGPYAEGEFSVFVPYTAFQSMLSPKGAALFGGARPAGDDKSD